MKILIAISSKEYSGSTLDVGMNIARALNASTTILDVGEKINELSIKDISITNELMDTWNIDRPGVDVLEWAYHYLVKNNFIVDDSEEDVFKNKIVKESTSNRTEVYLKGSSIKKLSLILRNGDIVTELRDEVRIYDYGLTIIGGSSKRSLAHDFIEYIESSILIVNSFNLDKNYRILLAVDDAPGTANAVKYAVRVAQAFKIKVDLINISKDVHLKKGDNKGINRARKMLRRCSIDTEILLKIGDPVENIIKTAGDDHIIIMGASTLSPLAKFFVGSKPLDVIKKSTCPVLIVK